MQRATPERILEDFKQGRIDRRHALGRLGACFAAAFVGQSLHAGEAKAFAASALNHIALRVTDVDRSRDFYVEHFGAEVLQDNPPHNCFIGFGQNFVALFRAKTVGLDHFCFTIDGYDASDALKRLKDRGLEAHRVENRVYFKDPDGIEGQLAGRFSSWPGGEPPG